MMPSVYLYGHHKSDCYSVTPRSLAVVTGVINLPRKNKDISSGSFFVTSDVCQSGGTVLSALINKLFVEHQAATHNKSFLKILLGRS